MVTPATFERALRSLLESPESVGDALSGVVTASWPRLVEVLSETGTTAERAASHVVRGIETTVDLLDVVRSLHWADIVLTRECAAGNRRAVRAFERQYGPFIERSAARIPALADPPASFRLALVGYLLGPRPDAEPPIVGYSGRGSLQAWLKVTVVRRALKLCAPVGDHAASDQNAIAAGDPEIDFMRRRYRQEFREAFESAVAGLTRRERILLRYAVVEGLNVAQIGAIYHLPRSTAARHVAKARTRLRDLTQRHLVTGLAIPSSELASIAKLVRSDLDISVRRLLGTSTS